MPSTSSVRQALEPQLCLYRVLIQRVYHRFSMVPFHIFQRKFNDLR